MIEKNKTPKIIKSNKTIEEINQIAQARLAARKALTAGQYKLLFGHGVKKVGVK